MTPPYVWMTVPRVVAELLGLAAPVRPAEVAPMIHDEQSILIRQRVQNVNLLADVIQMDPKSWGVYPSEQDRRRLASRLLEMRARVRSCAIREAAEVAAL